MAGRKTDYEKVREKDRREKISITRCLKKLFDIEEELEKNGEDMNVPALRLRHDISISLLKKRLPDLKATEITGPGGGPIVVKPFEFEDPSETTEET